MSKTRILVVDDSVVMRRLVCEALSTDPDLTILGTAANGRLAMEMVRQERPDLVLLDVEMPEMDGLQTVSALRALDPSIRTIMLSRFTRQGATVTVDALLRGASDHVYLPQNTNNREAMVSFLQEQLIPKLKGPSQPRRRVVAANNVADGKSSSQRIRVLVVNDSAVMRRVVSEALSGDPALEVVGTAADGKLALAAAKLLRPDLVLLDVEMPEMDGLQALSALRTQDPSIRTIMLSRFTRRGASVTVDALLRGADDHFYLPESTESLTTTIANLREALIPQIKALCFQGPRIKPAEVASKPTVSPTIKPPVNRAGKPIEIVVIGVSTGGPQALSQLMMSFPADWPTPIVIVQHMPPMFTKLLAGQLANRTAMEVSEAVEGDVLHAGHAWIAPGDYHTELVRDDQAMKVRLTQGLHQNCCRPSVDVLFRSVAATYGASALAVVLTGMGQDGLHGCESIVAAGGQVLVQDEASSVVWGMPGAVAKAGLADKILPLDQIGTEITRIVWQSRSAILATRETSADTPLLIPHLENLCEQQHAV